MLLRAFLGTQTPSMLGNRGIAPTLAGNLFQALKCTFAPQVSSGSTFCQASIAMRLGVRQHVALASKFKDIATALSAWLAEIRR